MELDVLAKKELLVSQMETFYPTLTILWKGFQ